MCDEVRVVSVAALVAVLGVGAGGWWTYERGWPAEAVLVFVGGFRSSFRDWVAEETEHGREVIEAALAHVVRKKVEAAYARSDLFTRRRGLMDDWDAYLGEERGRVTPLRR